MNTKKTLLMVAVLVLVVASWIFLRNKESRNEFVLDTPTPIVSPELNSPEINLDPKPANLIIYTDSGYTSSTITIKKGETVTWKNQSSGGMWTASAVHPTHKAYPGTNISMCDTNTLVAIFDACKAYGPGESWSFKFDNVGTWGYHNHVRARDMGKIVVQ